MSATRICFVALTVALVLPLVFAAQVPAAVIVDLDPNDLNIITGAFEDDALNELLVFEDYNETKLTPYPSHDGMAIVNPNGGYFDKVVTFGGDDFDGVWLLDFRVHNTTPYLWSDYHFEFWDEDFLNRLDLTEIINRWDAEIFENSSFDGSVLQFWAPGWQANSQTQQFLIWINNPQAVPAFGLRQVATTVIPEPSTIIVWSLLGALAITVGWCRRRRHA